MVVVMINLFSNRRNVCKGDSAVTSAQHDARLPDRAKLSVLSVGYFGFGATNILE